MTEKPNLVRLIVPFGQRLFQVLNDERGWDILRRRYGLEGSKTYTLEDLGLYYDLTRERIRQIESKAEKRLRNAILGYAKLKAASIPDEVIIESKLLLSNLKGVYGVITEQEVCDIVENRYGSTANESDPTSIGLLMAVYGFSLLPKRITGLPDNSERVWLTSKPDRNTLKVAIESVRKALRASAEPLSYFDLKVILNKGRKNKLSDEYIRAALKIPREVEIVGENLYQARFEHLSSLADKVYRLLKQNGEPMHLREIARAINKRLVDVGLKPDVQVQSFHGPLISDHRFKPIGRSGKWTLASWVHVHRHTTIELMKNFLHSRQEKA